MWTWYQLKFAIYFNFYWHEPISHKLTFKVYENLKFTLYWVTHNYNHEWILLFKQRFLQKKCHSLFWHYIYRVSSEIILFRERGWQRQSHNFHPGCIFLLFTLYQSLTTLLECGNYSRAETNQGRKLLIIRRFLSRKLFKGGNYSRAETIRGNTVTSVKLDVRVIACNF